ncbi:MAG: glycosyltransferase [Chloroflexota bacterium]
MKISVLINSRDRFEILERALESSLIQNYPDFEILILDDCSQKYNLCKLVETSFPNTSIQCFRSETSLGVASGRNFLMSQATGDVFCILDDDAYFGDDQCLANIALAFNSNSSIGILATKIIDHVPNSQEVIITAPFTQWWIQRQPQLLEKPQLVSYYIGTCHAIHRSVIDEFGGYQPDLMFGEEELDLSYRAIQAKLRILYWPDVTVHHYPQPSVVGQSGSKHKTELYYHIRNRFFLAYKYLPWRYIPVYLTIWLSRYFAEAIKSPSFGQFVRGVISGLLRLKGIRRSPLGSFAIKYLHDHYGRIWY